MERLAEKTLATFGGVHILCNNAGVGPGGVLWENTVADWEWVLGVNVWGVIHGVRVFVPIMLRQDSRMPRRQHRLGRRPAVGPGHGHLLRVQARGGDADANACTTTWRSAARKIGVSVLCPAYVPTGIIDSERNRPALLRNAQRAKTAGGAGARRA